jgi:predicted flap endonuclease-1-like 5' DNA nuclease
MRSDYALYAVAIIFFILTAIVLAYQVEMTPLWTITTTVLGLFFIGLGYTLRPKPQQMQIEVPSHAPPTPPTTPTPTVTEVAKEEKIELPPPETAPSILELTNVKGIKTKRSEQLKTLGINNIEDLSKASAKELAAKLKISPKITEKWIENAKQLLEKS